MDWGSGITYFGTTTLKDKEVTFGIKDYDRSAHVALLGKEETRIELLAAMALSDAKRKIGTVIMDAEGTLGQCVMERSAVSERDRFIFLDPSDGEYPFSWNPLAEFRALSSVEGAPSLSKAVASAYGIPASPLSDALAEELLQNEASSLVSVFDLVTEEKPPALASSIEEHVTDRDFIAEHGKYIARDTLVRNLLGQTQGKFSFASLAEGRIVIFDFSRIKMFPTRVTPLTRIALHALHARARASGTPISLFMHNSLRSLQETDLDLFSGRALSLTLSDTGYAEEDQPLREKAITRCASVMSATPYATDSALIEKLFYPYTSADELARLEDGEFALALAIDGVRSRPFFAHTLPLPDRETSISYQDLVAASRDAYTVPRAKVDQLFKKKDDDTNDAPKQKDPGSFSDTFRSIFSKKPAEPQGGAPAAGAPLPPPPKAPAPTRPAPKNEGPSEIPEDELKEMLYVAPTPA